MTVPVAADPHLPGRTKITARAVRRVVTAVTADAMEVPASSVSVELEDLGGALSIVAKSPVRLTPLGRSTGGSSLVERLSSAQSTISERVLTLTGSDVRRVDLRITGAELQQRRRVS